MVYPDVKLKNRSSIISNYSSIVNSFDVENKLQRGGENMKQMIKTLDMKNSETVNLGELLDDFIKDELNTSGSIDEKNQLILKGCFQNTKIEGVLEKFVRKYCLCTNCNSCDTLMIKQKNKNNKITSIACLKCSATLTVK